MSRKQRAWCLPRPNQPGESTTEPSPLPSMTSKFTEITGAVLDDPEQ
jgi:hypothetical protein